MIVFMDNTCESTGRTSYLWITLFESLGIRIVFIDNTFEYPGKRIVFIDNTLESPGRGIVLMYNTFESSGKKDFDCEYNRKFELRVMINSWVFSIGCGLSLHSGLYLSAAIAESLHAHCTHPITWCRTIW